MQYKLFPLLLCWSIVISARAQDSATAVASHRYEDPNLIQKVFAGSNYRDIWSMPVTARVFRLKQDHGGFTIDELGGGMQTKSLRLEDKKGQQWVLRFMEKDVEKAMDAVGIKNKGIRSFSQQMVSASQPYGSLTLVPMAKALGILSTDPELVYVPDDPAFGEYRVMFANSLALLEKREPVFHEGDKVQSTEKMLKTLKEHKDYHIDQKNLLQARLLDMLVADWDRHGDQWKWEVHKEGNGRATIYPIPRDHDQAYFNSTGFVFNVLRTFNTHQFVGFRKRLKLKPLNYKEWAFDKTLMKDLKEEDWRTGIQTFQAKLTDAVLEEGVRRLPAPVYAEYGSDFLKVLKIRRDKMMDDVMDYYHFLQTHPEKVAKQGEKQKERMERAEKLKETGDDGDAKGENKATN